MNIAGQGISSVKDTGMYGVWEQDEKYIFGEDLGTTPFLSNAKIEYTNHTLAYMAPETVYRTYRTMNRDSHVNLKTTSRVSSQLTLGFFTLLGCISVRLSWKLLKRMNAYLPYLSIISRLSVKWT